MPLLNRYPWVFSAKGVPPHTPLKEIHHAKKNYTEMVSFEFHYLFLEKTKGKRGCGVNITFPLSITFRAVLVKCYRCFLDKIQ